MTTLEKKILDKLFGNCKSDWNRHARLGFTIYESEEEYIEDSLLALCDEEDARRGLKFLDKVEVDGKNYLVSFNL